MNFYKGSSTKYLESFNFSSLTDVVMQLLIFFLLTFSFANTQGMNIVLPKAAVGDPPQRPTISVSIGRDGTVFINNDAITKSLLGPRLSALMQKDKNQQIVVRADKNLILQDVVEVLDIARGVGATRLFIATDTEPGSK